MEGSDPTTDICVVKIDDLIARIVNIRNCAIDMKDGLTGICTSAKAEVFIDTESITSSIEYLKNYSQMQEDFFKEMAKSFPEFADKNYLNAIEFLQNAKFKCEAQEFQIILASFQQVVIDNPEVEPLLEECKKSALALAQIKERETLESRVWPYSLFLKVVYDQDIELTKTEEEALENKFPRPIPRLLYQGKFYLSQYDSNVIDEKVDAAPEIKLEENIDEDRNGVSPIYSFRTEKEGTDFHVKEILAYLRQPDILDKIKLLSMLNNCQVVSAEQLVRWIFKDENLFKYYINPLIKKGYITEIKEIGKEEEYYCLSEKGMLMFTKKDVINEFNKRKWLLCKQTLIRTLREREDLINKTLLLNETALRIIHDREDPLSSDYFHHETTICQIPYLTFTSPEKYYLLITEGNQHQGAIEEINGILNNDRFNILVYLPIEDTDEDAWEMLNNLSIDISCCYIARIMDKCNC